MNLINRILFESNNFFKPKKITNRNEKIKKDVEDKIKNKQSISNLSNMQLLDLNGYGRWTKLNFIDFLLNLGWNSMEEIEYTDFSPSGRKINVTIISNVFTNKKNNIIIEEIIQEKYNVRKTLYYLTNNLKECIKILQKFQRKNKLYEYDIDLKNTLGAYKGPRYNFIKSNPRFKNDKEIINTVERYRQLSGGDLPLQTLSISRLIPTQKTIDSSRLESVTDNKFSLERKYPFVVQLDYKYYIIDGHHRITRDKTEGKGLIVVRLLNLDQNITSQIPWKDDMKVITKDKVESNYDNNFKINIF